MARKISRGSNTRLNTVMLKSLLQVSDALTSVGEIPAEVFLCKTGGYARSNIAIKV
jgi:hypothetical protein